MFRHIVIGIDGSSGSALALDRAIELAALAGATIHAVAVEEHLPAYAATVGEMDEAIRFENAYYLRVRGEALRSAESRAVRLTFEIVRGHAADCLVHVATARGADLLVVGHTGHATLRHFLLGSTADRVVEHARCPVLVVR